jgi:transposase-like protein
MATQNETSVKAVTKPRAIRGKWTTQQRQEIVAASLIAGASVNEVAERYGVRANLISAWRRKHARASTAGAKAKRPARFAAVRVSRTAAPDGIIEIDLSNHCIRVRGIVDAGMLREVLAATR